VLEDVESAPIDSRLKAMLRFLEKMTLRPEGMSPLDGAALRAAGVSDEAAEDAIGVALAFNLIDRLADSFAFQVPPDAYFRGSAPRLLKRGYRIG
jgi:alkylhydroperoxidase family enzyme